MSAPDITLIGIAEGSFPPTEAEARAMAAEVLRLRGERDALRRRAEEVTIEARDIGWERDSIRAAADSIAAAARAYRDATDVPDGDYDATRHTEALAALNRVLGGGR